MGKAKAKKDEKKATETKVTGPTTKEPAKGKQLSIEGTQPKKNEAVDDACFQMRKDYLSLLKAKDKYTKAREHVKMLMLEHGVKVTTVVDDEGDDVEYELDQPEAKVKMRKVDDE